MKWVFDELAFPRTKAAVWESWRGARFELGEARARRVGDLKWSGREIDGEIWD